MAEVVSLRGEPLADPAEPVDDVVALARDLLERAEAGTIKGLVACVGHSDDTFQGRRAGSDTSYGMLGVMSHLFHIINDNMREDR